MDDTGLTSPRGDYAKCVLHLVFENWACKRTCCIYVPANKPGHVTTVALAQRTSVMELDNPVSIRIGPMNKLPWPERLMASTTLTGRAMVEFCLPGVAGYFEESFVK